MTTPNTENTNSNSFAATPLSLSDLLIRAFQLFAANLGHYLSISLVVMLPLTIIFLLGNLFSGQAVASFNVDSTTGATTSSFQTFSEGVSFLIASCTFLLLVLGGVFYPWMEGALTYSVFERGMGRTPSFREAYAATRPRFSALWASNLLARLVLFSLPLIIFSCVTPLFFGFMGSSTGADNDPTTVGVLLATTAIICVPCLLILFGFVGLIGTAWRFRTPVIVAEGAGATDSLSRSSQLTKGLRGLLFGRNLAFWWMELVFVISPFVLWQFLRVASAQDESNGTVLFALALLFLLISLILELVLRPIHFIYVALLYLDTRVRKENLFITPTSQPTQPVPIAPQPPASNPNITNPYMVMPPQSTKPTVQPQTQQPQSVKPPITNPNVTNPYMVMTPATPAQKIGALFNRLRTEGPSADVLNELGMAYMDVGDLGGSLDSLTRARQLAPNDADIAYNLVLLHRQRKDTDAARKMMHEYLRLETNAEDIERVKADVRFRGLL